jgi:hypothetical protein
MASRNVLVAAERAARKRRRHDDSHKPLSYLFTKMRKRYPHIRSVWGLFKEAFGTFDDNKTAREHYEKMRKTGECEPVRQFCIARLQSHRQKTRSA